MPKNADGSIPTDDNSLIVAGGIGELSLDGSPAPVQEPLVTEQAPDGEKLVDTTTTATDPNADANKEVQQQSKEVSPKDEKRVSPDEGPAVDLSDFMAAKHGHDPKTPEQKKVDADKLLKDKKVETKTTEVDVKPKDQQTQQQTRERVARDYTGFEEADVKLLKNMGNDAFNAFRPLLLEHRKIGSVLAQKDKEIADLKVGKQMMPEAYYEHENGFVLSPEFNNAATELNQAGMVQKHWQNQLGAIRRGEEWQDAVGIDSKTGNLILGKKEKATGEAEAEVMGYITSAANQLNRVQQKMHSVQNEFTGRHREAVTVLKNAEKQHFAAYDDPKHPYHPVIKNITEAIPKEFRNSPLVPLLAKAVAAAVQNGKAVQLLRVELARLDGGNKGQQQQQVKVSAQQQNAGPTEGSVTESGGNAKGGASATGDDFGDFIAAKNS